MRTIYQFIKRFIMNILNNLGLLNAPRFGKNGSASDLETVTIGTQTWTKKNVDLIVQGARVYGDNEDNRAVYGGLYTFEQLATIEAAYPGFHVPTIQEWDILRDFLGGPYCGGKLKEAGTAHWQTPNTSADNSSGFTGLPGGGYRAGSNYFLINQYAYFWSKSESAGNGLAKQLCYNDNLLSQGSMPKTDFWSVRLVKNA